MKKLRFTVILALLSCLGLNCFPQNLIANGSFEDTNTCSESDAECSPEAWKTTSPLLLVYQGQSNKYVGFTIFNQSIHNTRQYLQIKLLCPLVKDKRYKLSLKLLPGQIQVESIGALFSDSIIFYNRDILINIKPTIDFQGQISKTTMRKRNDWNEFTIEYKAQGFEKYLIIGNFQSDSEQKRNFLEKPKDFTNYLYNIDDIELIPIDNIEICPDYDKVKEILYSLNGRHPLRRYNLFGEDVPQDSIVTEENQIIDTIRLSNILFEFNSFEINAKGIQHLDSLSIELNKKTIDFIKIHGHTDSIGSHDYNIRLSLNRAYAIKNYLSTKDLLKYITEIQGYGDKFPLDSNSLENGRQNNRRVELIIKYK
jgi:outer membrane protein OmpA-like peptidoglycan-associated protein